MTPCEILEIVKISGWSAVIGFALIKRKKISPDTFWFSIISSILMITSGFDEVMNNIHLHEKSLWWSAGNISVIAGFMNMVRNSVRFYDGSKVHLSKFINRMAKDKKEIDKLVRKNGNSTK